MFSNHLGNLVVTLSIPASCFRDLQVCLWSLAASVDWQSHEPAAQMRHPISWVLVLDLQGCGAPNSDGRDALGGRLPLLNNALPCKHI